MGRLLFTAYDWKKQNFLKDSLDNSAKHCIIIYKDTEGVHE